MGNRTWIKLYCDKWLDGTIREESPEVRAVFIDLLALAGSGRWGDAGVVKLTENHGYSYQDLSKIFGISVRKCKRIISSLVKSDRIAVDSHSIICITKWSKYQSEYERQRSYRKAEKVTPKVTPKVTDEKEIEKENLIKNKGVSHPMDLSVLKERLHKSTNKIGALVGIFRELHSSAPPADFVNAGDRLAGIAMRISDDYDYLLSLIVKSSTRVIDGSHLNYIQGMLKPSNAGQGMSARDAISWRPFCKTDKCNCQKTTDHPSGLCPEHRTTEE
jgi:hypothetical protein